MIKTFISYKHSEASHYKLEVQNFINNIYNMSDGSLDSSIEDRGQKDENIRQEIRDKYIKSANVIVVLVTPDARNRKFIDWEIAAGMFNGEVNKACGVIVIDFVKNWIRTVNENIKKINFQRTGNSTWIKLSNSETRNKYKHMPDRVVESFIKGAKINVIPGNDWRAYLETALKDAHENINFNVKNNFYENGKLRKRNSESPQRGIYL